jgi:hopanoid biosynthesis associated protein HpnK
VKDRGLCSPGFKFDLLEYPAKTGGVKQKDSCRDTVKTISVKAVIFNADDFGAHPKTNAAIIQAHTGGVLTSASLMVNEPAAAEAVALALGCPALAVGLHLTLSCGKAALPSGRIPRLVCPEGRFRADPARAGLVYFFSRAARRELTREVEAQFQRFAETGLPFSHVDGHQHLHMHPVVWDSVLTQCETHRVRRVRIPNEEFRPASPERVIGRRFEWLCFRALRRRCLRKLTGRGFFVPERVYGHLETGRMSARYLTGLLPRLGGQTNEIYLHPGTPHAQPMPDGSPEMDVELDALLHPSVVIALEQHQLLKMTYAEAETWMNQARLPRER